MKTANINVRIDAPLKDEAETILETLGLSRSQAITLFYRQIVLQGGLPFDVKVPGIPDVSRMNEEQLIIELQKSIEAVREGRTISSAEAFRNVKEKMQL